MSFSLTTILELRQERERLQVSKAALDARINAIDALLAPMDGEQVPLPMGALNGTSANAPRAISLPHEPSKPSPSANNGLRAAILDVLKRTPGGARARDIAKKLEMQGFTNDSPTPLTTRVYNDLWRLAKAGNVNSGDGVFALKEGTN